MLDGGWWTEMTDDEIACGGPRPPSMRGGALVGAFDQPTGIRERSREVHRHIHVFTNGLS